MSMSLNFFSIGGAILILAGELLALRSIANLKKLLIFSTVAEFGYLLIGLGNGSVAGVTGAFLHLSYQAVIRSLVFLSAWRLARHVGSWDLGSLRGIHAKLPITALLFGFGMFSFMGLSPFKGAISKFIITYAAIESGNYLVAAFISIGAVIAAVYILRAIQTICFEKVNDSQHARASESMSLSGCLALLLACLTAILTVYPEPLIHFCEHLAFSSGLGQIENGIPHFEGPWPLVALVPYLGAFGVFAAGKVSFRLRNCLTVLLAVGSLVLIYFSSYPDSFAHLISLLFGFVCTLVAVYSIGYLGNKPHSNRYFFFLFLMYGSLVGLGAAKDLGNFYLFWELMTWSSYLLVIHKQSREALRAGYKYFIMCFTGASIMHYGILLWHKSAGTFELDALHMAGSAGLGGAGIIIALFLFIGLAVKAGLFPMHSWLPDAHPVAPSSISAPMSGILTKAGLLGLIKFLPLLAAGALPFAEFGGNALLLNLIMLTGVCTLFLGELMALRQNDIKRMLAYSTLAQVGEIALLISLNTWISTVGAIGHVLNHALMKNLLFLAVGSFILRAGSQHIDKLAGLGRRMPITGACFGVGVLAIMGLPPFNGFISKFLMLHAAVDAGAYPVAVLILAASLIGTLYYGRLLKVLFFTPADANRDTRVAEAPLSMRTVTISLAFLCVLFGIFPELWLQSVVDAVAAIRGEELMAVVPNLTMNWPVSALILLAGAACVLCLRQMRHMGLLAAGAVVAAGLFLFLTPHSYYGVAFAIILLLSAALSFIYAAQYMDHSHSQNRFFAVFLLMTCGLTGLALSSNLFNFFAFWEIMSSWPLFFAIIHEESAEARREGTKYFLFNMIGASLIFLGVLLMGKLAGSYEIAAFPGALKNMTPSRWCIPLLLMTAGFFMKAAMLPVRIDWQMHPATAPTPVSGYISAVLLKTAPFGLLILWFVMGGSVLDTPTIQNIMYVGAWVAAVTIFYAAYKAVTQSGIKGVLIYSTVSQLGYILLGICLGSSLGVSGGLLHLVNHMVFKNLAFLCAGALMYRTHAHSLNELGGIGRRMPLTTLAFGIAAMAAAGVPPFNGFTSKWMLYNAMMDQNEILLLLLALSGSVLTLAYFIKFLHSAFFGHPSARFDNVSEVGPLMLLPMGILASLCIVTGIFPGLLLSPINMVMQSLNLPTVSNTLFGIAEPALQWNATLVCFMVILALAMVVGLLRLMGIRIRRTHVHLCGVTELPGEQTNVSAENLYEAPFQLLHKLKRTVSSPFIRE